MADWQLVLALFAIGLALLGGGLILFELATPSPTSRPEPMRSIRWDDVRPVRLKSGRASRRGGRHG